MTIASAEKSAPWIYAHVASLVVLPFPADLMLPLGFGKIVEYGPRQELYDHPGRPQPAFSGSLIVIGDRCLPKYTGKSVRTVLVRVRYNDTNTTIMT